MKDKQSTQLGNVTTESNDQHEVSLKNENQGGVFRLQTILVPLDFSKFSDKALDYALAFGGQFHATLVLLHVVEPVVYPENYVTVPAVNDDIHTSLLKAAETRLAQTSQRLQAEKVKVKTVTRLGRPFTEITDAAAEYRADLIVLATHGYTGLKHVLLGSTAERVVRHAPCPVLTVRADERDFVGPG